MKNLELRLETLTCPSCSAKIGGALTKIKGVNKDTVEVLFNTSRVKLQFNSLEVSVKEIENEITKLGFEVKKALVK